MSTFSRLPVSCRIAAFTTIALSEGSEYMLPAQEANMLLLIFQYAGSSRWSISSGDMFRLSETTALLLPGQYAEIVYALEETRFSIIRIYNALPDDAPLLAPRKALPETAAGILALVEQLSADRLPNEQGQWREALEEALSSFSSDLKTNATEIPACVQSMKELLDTQYMGDVSLDSLSVRLGRSKYYLARLFREHYGTTPGAYLSTVRLEKARRLLGETKLNVGEIGKRVGLENAPYFISLFKRHYGMTPQQYRMAMHDLHL